MIQHDPIQIIRDMGYRVVWMEDFDHQVTLVDDVRVALIDHRVERQYAASAVLELLSSYDSLSGLPDAS